MSETAHLPALATAKLPAVKAPKDALTELVTQGNLALLTPDQKREFYVKLCESLGVNPLTRPFQLLELNNKLVPYATKDLTEQLRKLYKVSLRVTNRWNEGDVYLVEVEASTYDGRKDFATGAVPLASLKTATDKANAYMKAETKAKRRATLSVCGLGFMDETELETVRGAKPLTWDRAMGDSAGSERITQEQVNELDKLAESKGIDRQQLVDILGQVPVNLTGEQFTLAKKMLELRVTRSE